MTEISRTVLDHYQIRKTKKQKTAFIEFVRQEAERQQLPCRVERGMLGARNIVVGDPDAAKVVYTAHYDTCPRLPFPNFISPKNVWLYLLYQVCVIFLFIFLPIFLIGFGIGAVSALLGVDEIVLDLAFLIEDLLILGALALILVGPANKHTANDNTSGVTVLLELMQKMPADQREHVAFVFFDLEEMGLFGSAGFASKHKKALKNTPVVNFDCVSDGDTVLFALRRGAAALAPTFETNFPDVEGIRTEVHTRGVFYPSDQMNFPCGIGVAALKSTKNRKLLYMDRIHTNRDTVYREENIAYLVDGSIRLAQALS